MHSLIRINAPFAKLVPEEAIPAIEAYVAELQEFKTQAKMYPLMPGFVFTMNLQKPGPLQRKDGSKVARVNDPILEEGGIHQLELVRPLQVEDPKAPPPTMSSELWIARVSRLNDLPALVEPAAEEICSPDEPLSPTATAFDWESSSESASDSASEFSFLPQNYRRAGSFQRAVVDVGPLIVIKFIQQSQIPFPAGDDLESWRTFHSPESLARNEAASYDRLNSLQGDVIPLFYGKALVSLLSFSLRWNIP